MDGDRLVRELYNRAKRSGFQTAAKDTAFFFWLNPAGELITLENQDLTDSKDLCLQIVKFVDGDRVATEIVLGPEEIRELRNTLPVLDEDLLRSRSRRLRLKIARLR